MTSPDSWVRSAYSVFWSRPGSSGHDYQPVGVTRRPRPRRLRGWLPPLAAVLVLTVLGLSTLGLVTHRYGGVSGISSPSSDISSPPSGDVKLPPNGKRQQTTVPQAPRTRVTGQEDTPPVPQAEPVPPEQPPQPNGETLVILGHPGAAADVHTPLDASGNSAPAQGD